jgi:prepilin-type N-terminal cleavage/methylation domain-containing protein
MRLVRRGFGIQDCGVRISSFAPRRARRGGFSLIEVILAVAILTGALAILGELARSGLDAARTARDTNQAVLLCESKLAEVLAGIQPLESVQAASFDDSTASLSGMPTIALDPSGPPWLYSIDVAPIDENGLTEVRVSVTQDLPPEQKPVSVSLVRWVIDPTALATTEAPTDESTSSQSSSSTSTSPSTSNP